MDDIFGNDDWISEAGSAGQTNSASSVDASSNELDAYTYDCAHITRIDLFSFEQSGSVLTQIIWPRLRQRRFKEEKAIQTLSTIEKKPSSELLCDEERRWMYLSNCGACFAAGTI
jgi:hypothetical protein